MLSGPRSGLVMVRASLSRAKVKEGLAVAAAEQEDEPLQVSRPASQRDAGHTRIILPLGHKPGL